MILPDDVFRIGTIGRPHGLGGEVSLHFTDDVFDRVDADYLIIETEGILVPFFMESYRFKTDTTALVKFFDIDTVEQARQLTDCPVFFPRSLADSDDEPPSLAEIVGFTVADGATGEAIGRIESVDETTLNTLLEISRPDGGTALVPYSENLVTDYSPSERRITMTIPEGLLNL